MKSSFFSILLLLPVFMFAQTEPSWINNFPSDSNYFTGIGSSNTGNKSSDYENALIKAKLNLAAEISTSIKAETEILTTDSSNYGISESFTEKINQSVDQNLKELEIVDTFYSDKEGYWVYIRINKNLWQDIQQQEMDELSSRLERFFDDNYFSGNTTTSDKIYKLVSAVKILEQSPYKMILSGSLGLYNGNIYDFLDSEIYRISSGITFIVDNRTGSMEIGEEIEIRVQCKSSDHYFGKIPIVVYSKNDLIIRSLSDINGVSRIKITSSMLNNNSNELLIKIDPLALGFLREYDASESFVPGQEQISIRLEPVSIYLEIISNKPEISYLNNPIRSLFSHDTYNFLITNDSQSSSLLLLIDITFTDFPRVLDNAPLMAGIECSMSLRKNSNIIFDYECGQLKDGGLTYNQAYNRVFNKLIKKLKADREYLNLIDTNLFR